MSSKKSLAKARSHQSPPTSISASVTKMEHFAGPLPPPDALVKYDAIVPGAAERIISMWEVQVGHRQGLERTVIDADVKDSKLGLILGFLIALAAIIVGGWVTVYGGHTTAGTIIAAIPVPTLAGVFVYGSRQRRREREGRYTENK